MKTNLTFSTGRTALLSLLALAPASLAQNPMTSFCSPGQGGVIPCPCSNPPSGPDQGCDNSSATGGAVLSASGVAALTADTLVFSTSGERPTATSIVLQALTSNTTGVAFGQGVRCLSNNLLRLYVKNAVGGSISAPSGTDLSVSARAAALGDTISPGQSRTYAVYYRDPVVLGGCMSENTFNITQSGKVVWVYSSTPPTPALVAIQPGSFQMGSNAAGGAPYFGDATTQPVHAVTLSYNFWMGATEVTQAQYQALMGTNPSQFVGPDKPVERVSWNDAQAYCTALTAQQAALGNVPAGYQFRLPTEAEWEYACRAGTTSEFNGGSGLLCSEAEFEYSYHSSTACLSSGPVAVASYLPNNFGLYDMHGNVREWNLDTYTGYSAGAATDPYISGGFFPTKVTRGGSWDSNSNLCRSAYRSGTSASSVSNAIGFRVVLGPILSPTVTLPIAPQGFVGIQPGTFQQGSNAPNGAPYYGENDDPIVRQVTISYSFCMGATEVTQAQYQALMGTNPSFFPGANNPVEQVSWVDAQAYCAALTAQQAALGNVPAGYQFRLPTEAEWEYACRAGTTTEFNTGAALFCGDAKINYSYHSNSSCGSNSTVPVSSYAPNAWGLYDMHGNVWEWCLDSWSGYTPGPVTDPFVTGGIVRVARGGSWYAYSSTCRSAFRLSVYPDFTVNAFTGFRVVLAPVLVP
jgi:formylglycine-generating enzyme required for sulfatase activity